MSGKQQLRRPPGTRDLYPDDLLRRRYVTDTWRRVSLRHGFDEIDGPTFETADLYAVKSGEGILGELFQAFSGKSPDEVARVRETGRAPFALRPEFTPTLARMYAAKASALPGPTKWFSVGPYFRAERPQRGRLREFLQWNADIVGLPAHDAGDPADVARAKAWADAETIATMVALLRELGFSPSNVQVRISDRALLTRLLIEDGVLEEDLPAVFALFDAANKMGDEALLIKAAALGVSARWRNMVLGEPDAQLLECFRAETPVMTALEAIGVDPEWTALDPSIVRGLAYYTGTVFEVVARGERAIAGGGRYDSLIELFGGPPTPAVGFGLGDVVLSLLLDDLGLMPSGKDMLAALDKPVATRPEVFVLAAPGADEAHVSIDAVVAGFRSHGVHARRSFKTTRSIGKLLKDANQQHARLAVILEEDGTATLKGLDSGEERKGVTGDQIGGVVAEMLS